MRVLQIGKFHDPAFGGMETAVREICQTLRSDFAFHLLVANTRFRTEHSFENFPVTRVASLGTLFSSSLAPSFPQWVKRINTDLIHVHMPNPLAELSVLAANGHVPVVAHLHSDIVRQKRLLQIYQPAQQAFYRRVSRIILPSPNHLNVSKFAAQFAEKCRVVPFGIAPGRFELNEAGRAKVEKLREGPPAILYVGRLVSYKGVAYLLQAMTAVRARLWIIGTGPLEASLKELARKNGIADRVQFLGNVSEAEIAAYYQACEAFVLPSVTNAEMFGIVQLEAMACGKPVISTNLPTGVSWVNQQGKTGFLVPPANAGALAKAMKMLLDNPKLRAEMGAAGRERVRLHFTSEKMRLGIREVYEEALGARVAATAALPLQEAKVNSVAV